MKKLILFPLLSTTLLILITSVKLMGQAKTPTLYVTGTVLSDEKMLVSVLGTKTIEGNVVSAEINGKKTEAKTNSKGQAVLDFSAIASGLSGYGVAVIKSFDKNGNLLSTATTNVQQATSRIPAKPIIEQLPNNLPNNDVVTIPGQNLGADARLTCGDQVQQTLAASDKEMTVYTNVKPGESLLWVETPNGVSDSRPVNFYKLDFILPKSSITPRENVQAQVRYESIPVETKLIFTNKSPGTINMTIPGAQNAANECIYTVNQKNGSFPVNITGIIRGDFTIALNFDFKDQRKDSIPPVQAPALPVPPARPKDQNQPPAPNDPVVPPVAPPVAAAPPPLAVALKIKDAIIEGLKHFIQHLKGGTRVVDGEKIKIAGVIPSLKNSISEEIKIKEAEQAILDDKTFRNLVNTDPSNDKPKGKNGNLQNARDNIINAIKEEEKAIDKKNAMLKELDRISNLIPPLIVKMNSAIANEKKGLNNTATDQEKAVLAALESISKSLDLVNKEIDNATQACANAVALKNAAIADIQKYINSEGVSETQKKEAENISKKLDATRERLDKEKEALTGLSGDIENVKKLNDENITELHKLLPPK